ncbi:hypothetical protein LCGC14_2595500 [marine sediment metagenome]|uniref:Uncharacterized protein n=1 Tax=marine sediment metagenome TaxID=412755 RepID=A0A0F9CLC0_9ZZZZ
MKKVRYTAGRTRDGLLKKINGILEEDPTAELVGVVERNKLFTAFIQFEEKL